MMKVPIILSEHGDITIYVSPTDAECAIEAVDVKNNEYEVFDADARPLVLSTELVTSTGDFPYETERVRLSERPFAVPSEDVVKNLLLNFMNRAGISGVPNSDENFHAILNFFVKKVGFSK